MNLSCSLSLADFSFFADMDKLTEIMAAKRRALQNQIRPVRDRELEHLAGIQRQGGSFYTHSPPTVCPSLPKSTQVTLRGCHRRADLDAVEQARKYVNAEADCFSVLTDTVYFCGSHNDLWEVVDFLDELQRSTPCLRKDFMIHPIQVLEAAEAGARCILIIVRALPDDEIRALYDAATLAGLDTLFEIHEPQELEKALKFDPRIIGVNNRDLKRFKTDLAGKLNLQIRTISSKSAKAGFSPRRTPTAAPRGDAILVGEALMRADDPDALVEAFHQA